MFERRIDKSRQGVLMTEPSRPLILQFQRDAAASEARARLFRDAGYRERQAPWPDDVFPLLQEVEPDLVLLSAGDAVTGRDLCRIIKARPDHHHRKLLLLSAEPTLQQRIAALNAGADGFLDQSATPDELLATVGALLRNRCRCHQVEAALRDSEERLRLFTRDVPIGMAMLDRDMRYLAVSRRWIEEYGLNEETLIGRCHYELFPDMPDRWKAQHQRCLAGAVEQVEEEVVSRKTGQVKWNRWDVRPWRHRTGKIGGLIIVREDITGQRRGQESLRKAHAFLRQVIDTDPNFIFAKDEEGRFTLVNQAVADCYGTTVQDLLGKTDADFNPRPEEVAWFRREDQDVLQTGNERCIPEELITDAAGHTRWLQTIKRPILDERGRPVQVLGVSADITQRKQVEELLARQLYLTRTLTTNSTQALFLLDERGLCTYINPAAEAMFGYSSEEFRARPLHEMIHHHHEDGRPYPVSDCAIHRALSEGLALRDHEDLFIRKGGEAFPVMVVASPIAEPGQPLSIVIEVRDLTEEVRGKQALARMSDQLRLIVRSAGEGIYGLDLDGRAAFVNPAGAAMFGYAEEELLGVNLHRLLHLSCEDGSPCDEDNCPIYAVLRDGQARSGDDQTLVNKDGSPMAVAYTCSPMLESGRVVGAVLVLRDIREGKRVQDLIREGEERLRLALAAGQMGAWDVDLVTGNTRWDAKAFALFGATDDGVTLPTGLFYDRVHPEDREGVRSMVRRAIETGDLQHEFRVVHPDGAVRWLASRGLVMNNDQGPQRMVGVNFDITERKRMEERLRSFALELEWRVAERTQELEQSQERLRALATELNLTEQRERKRLATDLHDYLAQLLVLVRLKLVQIKRAAAGADTSMLVQAAEEVVNEALAYTRTLVTQLSPPVLHEFGLPAALKWLSEEMLRQELSVTVTQLVPNDLPLPDDLAVLLFQSVRELLLNVKKHAGTQDAMVTIEQQQAELRLTVRDYGSGLLRSPTGDGQSPALSSKFGLFSIRERMRAIGGRLELESVPGQGTMARLVVPLQVSRTREAAENQEEPAVDSTATSSRTPPAISGSGDMTSVIRVLLVDDHMMIREGLRGLLKDYSDVEVVGEAWDGQEALAFADQLRPDVVLMDVNMPKMDGIEATRRIKAAFRSMVVIGLSVNASPQVAEAMVASGADAFLSKEAAGEQIYQTIQAVAPRGIE